MRRGIQATRFVTSNRIGAYINLFMYLLTYLSTEINLAALFNGQDLFS